MCVSIETPRAAKNYINEILRCGTGDYYKMSAERFLRSVQVHRDWLLDHEIRDHKLQPKFVPTGAPAMALVNAGINIAIDRHHRLMELA
jgi:hypothetical protein